MLLCTEVKEKKKGEITKSFEKGKTKGIQVINEGKDEVNVHTYTPGHFTLRGGSVGSEFIRGVPAVTGAEREKQRLHGDIP